MKVCIGCGVEKELSNFSKDVRCNDGHRNGCKSCRKKGIKLHLVNKLNLVNKLSEGLKACSKCGLEKELGDFHKSTTTSGLAPRCRSCIKKRDGEERKEHITKYGEKYREANKERINKRNKKYREANQDCIRKYREDNRQYLNELALKYSKANPEKRCALSNKRRALKSKASPPWIVGIYKVQIDDFYALARIQGEATGNKYHVDHIHPLKHPLICGLHVPANLQILEASVNCSKNNKFEPYIESECDFTELWQARSNDRTQTPRSIASEELSSKALELIAGDGYTDQTSIDRIPRRNPSGLIKPKKPKAVAKGQLALF